MLARVTTFAIHGVESRRITVEVDIRPGLPAFSIIGLGDQAVREARERVRHAIMNSGLKFPTDRRVTVNLAPAYLRKEGPGFDLAIAVAILVGCREVEGTLTDRLAIFGELGLHGEVRPSRGVLAVAEGASRHGFDGVVVPAEMVTEARLIAGLAVFGVAQLADVAAVLGAGEIEPPPPAVCAARPQDKRLPDLTDIRGHSVPIRALTIAAAGGHNVLFGGPPGTGKTMLARRLPSILPPLTPEEAIEVTRIQSVAGLRPIPGLVTERPFRAPHHSISPSGLVGGGTVPAPGEVTLAHRGVLFLDELAEFHRPALEALRQPLEDGRVAIVRGQRTAVYPTQVMLVASTNPCPCGYAGQQRCRCAPADIARYRRRLSGPLLDRIDLHVTVARPKADEFEAGPVATSQAVRAEVLAARERQTDRFAELPIGSNAQMDAATLRRHAALDGAAQAVLRDGYRTGRLSPRGHDRVLRVARTIADLEGSEKVGPVHLGEALQLRDDAESRHEEDAA